MFVVFPYEFNKNVMEIIVEMLLIKENNFSNVQIFVRIPFGRSAVLVDGMFFSGRTVEKFTSQFAQTSKNNCQFNTM